MIANQSGGPHWSTHTVRLLPDGTVICDRTIAKIRGRERNWQSAAAVLERFGAAPLGPQDDARAWLATWLGALTRTARNPGKHVYLIGLDRAVKRALAPQAQRYPKFTASSCDLVLADRSAA